MKIVFTTNIFENHYLFRKNLIDYFIKKGHEIWALANYDGWEKKISSIGAKCNNLYNIKRGSLNPINDNKLLIELYMLYKKIKPDIAFHFTIKPNIYGSISAALLGIKSISTVEGLGYVFNKKGPLKFLVKYLYSVAFRYPKAIFFLNQDDKKYFEISKIIPFSKSRLIPGCGLNLEYFRISSQVNEKKRNNYDIIFLFMGRLLWDKGIGELAEAAAMVRRHFPLAEVWVLGRTDPDNPAAVPEGQIRQWEREGRFTWLGWVQDVRPLISQSDVVVLPSYREGIPRSLLEAMAMGKPIITTDSVGCREVIEDGRNGFMVPVKDTEALAAAMIKMIHLGEEGRREMGLYGRRKAEREFDERLVIQAYLREIDRILAAEGQAAKS